MAVADLTNVLPLVLICCEPGCNRPLEWHGYCLEHHRPASVSTPWSRYGG